MTAELLKLEDDEKILKLVRKHWFILFTKVFSIIFFGIAPLFLVGIFFASDATAFLPFPARDLYQPIGFLGSAWLLLVWMIFFNILTDYYLDMWIITNKRVITIDQQGFFRRSVASFRLERLQDITVDIIGLIATMLNFGNIRADTASHTDAFVIRGIPNPREIKALIQENADQVFTTMKQTGDTATLRTGV